MKQKRSGKYVLIGGVITVVVIGSALAAWWQFGSKADKGESSQKTEQTVDNPVVDVADPNPLNGRSFYRDDTREVAKMSQEHAELVAIANQPGTTWLTGPSNSDRLADRDIAAVKRTSSEAAKLRRVNVYQLYAIPDRDACAQYSNGGFANAAAYLEWVQRIVAALQADAVFTVEADAIAHTLQPGCMTAAEATSRLNTIAQAVAILKASPKVIGVYLDAAHAEWFPDPTVLVDPLRRAGVNQADGVTVNVSNFIATATITPWAQQLARALPIDSSTRAGVMIDTSRNGKGAPAASVKGDARWCNPVGRGLGKIPTTEVSDELIDAYFWGKNPGESDGNCFGNPPAGTFNLAKALELIRNAEQ